MAIVNRGFGRRRRPEADSGRVPPGQYVTDDFPVLSAGPTPRIDLGDWRLTVDGAVSNPLRWSWDEFVELPQETVTRDIHCVTSWSKLGTSWTGVSVDTLLEDADPFGAFLMVHSYGGYTTNLPIEDVLDGKAWVAHEFDGAPLEPEHGGPARLLVPHLYFWKSAKWVTRLEVIDADEPGFWEQLGYHDRGDPWREQRYQGD